MFPEKGAIGVETGMNQRWRKAHLKRKILLPDGGRPIAEPHREENVPTKEPEEEMVPESRARKVTPESRTDWAHSFEA